LGGGRKRGGTRWVYRVAVSRGGGLGQLALWVIEAFVREPEDRLCLIREGLRMVGYVPAGSPEAGGGGDGHGPTLSSRT
jgi:hypothetical protein